jgi:hypothetical protein
MFDGRDVVEFAVKPLGVVPVDVLGSGDLEVVDPVQGPRFRTSSAL